MRAIDKRTDLLNSLIKLKTILDSTPYLSMNEFRKKEGIHQNTIMIMVRGGIIENTFKSSTSPKWEWKSIKPNIAMVEEIMKREVEYNKKINGSKKDKMKTNTKDLIEKKVSILRDLKVLIDYNPETSISAFTSKNRMRCTLRKALVELKIIEGKPASNRAPYNWLGGEPDADMTYLVWSKMESIEKERNRKHKKNKETKKEAPKEVTKEISKELSHYESKVLFGLVTLKLKPVFK